MSISQLLIQNNYDTFSNTHTCGDLIAGKITDLSNGTVSLWDATVVYSTGNIVVHMFCIYSSIGDNNLNNEPVQNSAFWVKISNPRSKSIYVVDSENGSDDIAANTCLSYPYQSINAAINQAVVDRAGDDTKIFTVILTLNNIPYTLPGTISTNNFKIMTLFNQNFVDDPIIEELIVLTGPVVITGDQVYFENVAITWNSGITTSPMLTVSTFVYFNNCYFNQYDTDIGTASNNSVFCHMDGNIGGLQTFLNFQNCSVAASNIIEINDSVTPFPIPARLNIKGGYRRWAIHDNSVNECQIDVQTINTLGLIHTNAKVVLRNVALSFKTPLTAGLLSTATNVNAWTSLSLSSVTCATTMVPVTFVPFIKSGNCPYSFSDVNRGYLNGVEYPLSGIGSDFINSSAISTQFSQIGIGAVFINIPTIPETSLLPLGSVVSNTWGHVTKVGNLIQFNRAGIYVVHCSITIQTTQQGGQNEILNLFLSNDGIYTPTNSSVCTLTRGLVDDSGIVPSSNNCASIVLTTAANGQYGVWVRNCSQNAYNVNINNLLIEFKSSLNI